MLQQSPRKQKHREHAHGQRYTSQVPRNGFVNAGQVVQSADDQREDRELGSMPIQHRKDADVHGWKNGLEAMVIEGTSQRAVPSFTCQDEAARHSGPRYDKGRNHQHQSHEPNELSIRIWTALVHSKKSSRGSSE